MVLPTILLAALSLVGTGSGSVGSAYAFFESPPMQVHIDPLAPCAGATSASTASTLGATASGFVSFGGGSTTCGPGTVTVSGKKFRFDWMKDHGGPVIKLAGFSVTCTATESGSRSSIKLTGLSGIKAPNPIPPNYTVTIRDLARVVLNETIVPDPPDGSMTVNLMRIKLFPDSVGFNNGEITVGTVHCSPRG